MAKTKAKPKALAVPELRQAHVDAASFALLEPFVGTEPTRYYLQGVLVTPHADTGVYLVATNGHIMGVCYDPDGKTNSDWICPASPAFFAAARSGGFVCFRGDVAAVMEQPGDASIVAKGHGFVEHAPAIDGFFPEWRRVIPEAPRAQSAPVYLSSGYLLRLSRIIGSNRSIAFYAKDEQTPVVIQIAGLPNFLVVQMPVCIREAALALLPSWLPS